MKILHNEEDHQFELKTLNISGSDKYPLHWHGNIEIIYVKKGSIRLAIRKRTYDVTAGEFALINGCDHHAYHNGYKTSETKLEVCSFSPVLVNGISKLRLNGSYIAKNEDIDELGIRESLLSALSGLKNEQLHHTEYSDALIGAYIIQLVLNLQKTYIEKEDLGTTINVEYEHLFNNFKYNYEQNAVSEKTMSKFQLILDYLDKNFNDAGLTLTKLSEISSLSECYISELFTLIVGIKFKQYLNTLRINYALRLLSMSDVTISSAAYESGFETIRTFNSAFKRLKGVTPSEYLSGVKGNTSDAKIVTEIKNLRAQNNTENISYFGGGSEIKVVDDPENKRGKVFGVYSNTKNKSWTTFNVGMLFKAGMTYYISYDFYHLDDACGKPCTQNIIGTNLFYPESDGEAIAHPGGGICASTGDGWIHYEGKMELSEKYMPGIFDKFSVYGHPANDVGVNFLLDNISCYVVE